MANHTMCIGPECDRNGGWTGLCPSHYQQKRQGRDLAPLRAYTKNWDKPICSVLGCGRRHMAHGLCKQHGEHLKKYGELREIKKYIPGGIVGPCGIPGCDRPSLAKRRCVKHQRVAHGLAKFGLTLSDYAEMLESQDGVCAICRGVNANGTALSVDHDHGCCPGYTMSCGKCIRGLLCSNCNNGIGRMKDDPIRLRAAADYLERVTV